MAVNLDRFSRPVSWEQEPVAWAVCEACGHDIFPGDAYYETDYGLCCDDEMCLVDITGAKRKEAGA